MPARDPWARTRVGELSDPLLPRWFVLLAVALVPVALAVFVIALVATRGGEVGVADRRPPPAGAYTHDVGAALLGDAEPVPAAGAPCPEVAGLQVAGTRNDRDLLEGALAELCGAGLDPGVAAALRDLAAAGAHVRFAAFEATGVDSVAERDREPPRLLVNARFAQVGRPAWIAPLIAHDAVMLAGEPEQAATALAARRAEDQVCDAVQAGDERSRGCDDAATLLALPDPEDALRDAGYR